MKSNLRLSAIVDPITSFIRRFHMLLFFLLVSGGLFAAIMVLISIINVSSNSNVGSDNAINGSFDEDTIKRVENDTTNASVPGDRPSPFVE